MLSLLIEDSEKRAVESIFTDRFLDLSAGFTGGEARPIAVCPVKRIKMPWNSRVFSPKDPSAWTIQVALGGGFALPVAGTWPINYGADSSDAVISNNPTASEISNILNGLASVVTAGGVTVQGAAGFFTFTFDSAGARTMLSGDPALLVPLSLLTFEQVVAGDSVTNEVQILRIAQNAGTFATLSSLDIVQGITIDEVTAGGGGRNQQIRVNLPEDRYGGTWTFIRALIESEPIGFNDNELMVQTAIGLMSNIGINNISVQQDGEDSYLVTFIGGLANAEISLSDLSGSTSGLQVILWQSGTLDLRVPGIDLLLNGSDNAIVIFEVQAADETGYPVKILQRDVVLRKPVIVAQTTEPQPSAGTAYSKAEIDALTGTGTDVTVSTAGTSDLAPSTPFILWSTRFIVQAGSVAYVRKLTLDNARAKSGAIFRVPLEIAASANPTISVYDNTISGTLLVTILGDSDNAQYKTAVFEFDGTNWHFIGFEQ